MKFDIICFGSSVVDVFIHTDIAEKKDLISYPVGEKILITNLQFEIGGGGTNTSVAFSRFGFNTGCITAVSNDENGNKILNNLKKEKVKFLGKINNNDLTGYSVILDSKGGERTILTYKGANDKIKFRDLNLNNLNTKWLYFSSLLKESLITQKKLAIIMHKKGVKIAFNPSSYIIKNEDIMPLLKLTEVLILNKEESESLYNRFKCKDSVLEGLYSLGPKIIVITNKDKETLCFDGENYYSIIPNKNIKVIERTGAGDAFASGFVAGQIKSYSIEKSLKLGLKESESVISSRGAKNKLLKMRLK